MDAIDLQQVPRCLNPPSIATIWAALSAQGAIHLSNAGGIVNVAPDHHRAAIALACGAGIEHRPVFDGGAGGLAHRWVAVLPAAANQDLTAAGLTAGIKPGATLDEDLIALHRDPAAGSQDLGIAARLDQPAQLNGGCRQHRRVAAPETHMGGLQSALVGDRSRHRGIKGHAEQAVSADVQGGGGAAGQLDSSKPRRDHPFIGHLRCNQSGKASVGHRDRAFVDDSGLWV